MTKKDQLSLFRGGRRPETSDQEAPGSSGPVGGLPPVEDGSGKGVQGGKSPPPSIADRLALLDAADEQLRIPGSPDPQRPLLPFARRMSDLIRRLQLLERDAKAHLGITLPQAHAIHALQDFGSLRMQELASNLGLAQSTVTRLVAPLKRMDLLDRRPDRNDGRATRAFLTEKGTALVDELGSADRELYEGILDRLPETRRAEVVAAVELLHGVVLDLTVE